MKLVFFKVSDVFNEDPLDLWEDALVVPRRDESITLQNGNWGLVKRIHYVSKDEVHVDIEVLNPNSTPTHWEIRGDSIKEVGKKDVNGIFNYKLTPYLADSSSIISP